MWDESKNRQSFSHQGGKTGLLLIHGFTGSPGEMRPLGEHLADMGYSIEIPILAGHCTTIADMNKTRYPQWIATVEEVYRKLAARTDRVILIGHSMGGLISLHLASRVPVLAVVSSCTPIHLVDWRASLAYVVSFFKSVQSWDAPRNTDIEAYLGGYQDTPIRAVASFNRLLRNVKRELPLVKVPILIQQARQDLTVRPKSAEYIHRNIGSSDKRLVWYERSGHMLTVDVDRDEAWRDIVSFVQRVERGPA